MSIKCFISFNSKNRDFAIRIANLLKLAKVDVWIDEWRLFSGESLTDKIQEGILQSQYFILIMSPHSIKSNWVREELRAALNLRIQERPDFIIPLLIEDCNIPLFLRDYKFVDFRIDFESGSQELLKAIKRSKLATKLLSIEEIRREVVTIPRGSFLFGKNNVSVNISYDYIIDKYPVSRRKFYSFMYFYGYTDLKYWSRRGRESHKDFIISIIDFTPDEIIAARFGDETPAYTNEEALDYPIGYITFYEAEAYCNWIGGRLPTEIEIEKAGRGTDGRLYPWGNELDVSKCFTGTSLTFRVDDFTAGQSPFGVYNLAGNKNEFTAELAVENPDFIKDEIITKGWLDYWSESFKKDFPPYSIIPSAGCFPWSARAHPITFRSVYNQKSPYDSLYTDFADMPKRSQEYLAVDDRYKNPLDTHYPPARFLIDDEITQEMIETLSYILKDKITANELLQWSNMHSTLLGMDYVPEQTTSGISQAMIEFCSRRGRLNALFMILSLKRPDLVFW